MADHQKDKPVKPRLQSVPGWAAEASARAATSQPQAEAPRQAEAPPRPSPAAKPPPKAKSTAKPATSRTTTPVRAAASKAARRLKSAAQAFPRPRIDLSAIKWPSWKIPTPKAPSFKFKAPSLPRLQLGVLLDKLPRISLPRLPRPHLNKKLLAGSAATLAVVSLSVLFAKHAADNSDADAPLAPHADTWASGAFSSGKIKILPPVEEPKKQEKLSTLAQLPPPGATGEEDIARLMEDSKLPRDVIEVALHIYSHATPKNYKGHPEDKLEVIYSQGLDVLFARVHANKTVKDIYGFENHFGTFGFYSENGARIDRSGLSSPLKDNHIHNPNLTRVFASYVHPIRKKLRPHNGIDFPAQRGTPVYAVANGIVKDTKSFRGYGKTVMLNHSGNMQSLYAHLDGFANIKEGGRVQKGELIGYVGSTGMSTGPHLHFEIRQNGKKINPRLITAFSPATISPQDKPEFDGVIARIKNHLTDDDLAAAPATTPAKTAAPSLTETFKNLFHRPGDDKIKALIVEAAHRDGIHPDLPYRLFIKEAGVDKHGALRTDARSDTGAEGLCQFTEQTFMRMMKTHGERLGISEHADKIRRYIGSDRATYYTAGDQTGKILTLRKDETTAIPLCIAYMRDNIDYLKQKLGRTPNFTDVSIALFFGPGVAEDIIPAYDNPHKRKEYAYKFARPEMLKGDTNLSVFYRKGDRSKPYTVEQVYHMKREKMGTEPALITDMKRDRKKELASFQIR